MSQAIPLHQGGHISHILDALVRADGSADHAYVAQSASRQPGAPPQSIADLADAAYYLCMLHGRHPGVIDHAATRSADNGARAWLVQATDAFARERSYLAQVTVAVGPAPGTAGQADCEAAVSQQRHALDMLAQSDRRGCAMGAALALALDWHGVRRLLDMAALRVGLEPQPSTLPDREQTLGVVAAIGGGDAIDRAILFGARQLLSQHRGLWDLMQARAALRGAGRA